MGFRGKYILNGENEENTMIMMVNFDLTSLLPFLRETYALYLYFRLLDDLNFPKDEIHSFTA